MVAPPVGSGGAGRRTAKFGQSGPPTVGASDAAYTFTNAPGANAFPITSFSWVYVRTTPDPGRKAALNNFLHWVFDKGQQLGAQEGYSELPSELLAKVQAKVNLLQ